tara:strand:+ start:530 stop:1483 length:954 start_codon:yes stop_codon:yes gene_type:complete
MQGTAIIIGNMIGGITGGGGAILPTFFILGDGTIDGDNIIDESGNFLVSELAPAPPFTGLLDTYPGAAAGYSLRSLSSTYTGFAIKVQDNVGGATLDVGFDSNRELDTAAIAIYGGVNDVFVETWYDQSGNGNNSAQATSANRPKIYDGTTGVVTDNGKPSIAFSNTTGSMSGYTPANGDISFFMAANNTDTTSSHAFGTQKWSGTSNGNWFIGCQTTFRFYTHPGTSSVTATITQGQMFLGSAFQISGNKSIFSDGSAGGTATGADTSWTGPGLISDTTSSRGFAGPISEMIIYESDQTSNRTGIETNINDFYLIY